MRRRGSPTVTPMCRWSLSRTAARRPSAANSLRAIRGAHILKIGALDPVLRNAIDDPTFSLSRFMLAPPTGMSIVVRSGLRDWLVRIFAQLRSFELRMTLERAEHLG